MKETVMIEKEHVRSYQLDFFPEYTVTVGLFKDVTNVPELRKKLLKGQLNCALLNCNLITDVYSVLVACNKAVYNFTNSCMKTRNIHAEVLYNLSPSNSITGSLKTFGVADNQNAFMCVSFLSLRKDGEKDGFETVLEMAEGAMESLDKIETMCNLEEVKKLYKITEEELSIGTVSDAIVMRVTTKDGL